MSGAPTTGQPDLTVLILSYNVRAYLALAVKTSLAARRGLNVELIVVDNASSDGSADMVERDFPEVTLIRSPENRGFSGGNNLGMRVASGRYVMLVNPDVVVHPTTFEAIVGYLDSHPEVGAAGGRIINPDGSSDPGARRAFPSASAAFYRMVGLSYIFPRSSRFARYNLRYLDENQESEVDAISGCFMCVRREVLEAVGPLDEAFFMYGEDLDWSYRIRSAGWKIGYVPSAEIVHFKGESTRSMPRLRQLYEFHRAMHIFVRKHIAPRHVWPVTLLIEIGIFLRGVGVTCWRFFLAALVPILDLLLVGAGLVIAMVVRGFPGRVAVPPFGPRDWTVLVVALGGSWIVGAVATRLYRRERLDVARAAISSAIAAVISIVLIFLVKTINFSRIVTVLTWLFGGALAVAWRLAARHKRPEVAGGRLVLGCGTKAERYLSSLGSPRGNPSIIGVVRGTDDSAETTVVAGYPVIGEASDLPLLLRSMHAEELIVASERYRYADLLPLARRGGKYPHRIRLVPDVPPDAPNGEWELIDLELRKRSWT